MALLAEIDRSHLGRVEKAKNEITMLLLVKIAKALDVSVMQIMKEAGL
ncbi:helix-turn-helix domain-containing protein [Undibacterium sp.]